MFWAKAACDLRPPIATLAFFGPLIFIVVVSLFSLLFALFRSLSPGPAAADLVLAVASACCVAASAAAFASRHACCVCDSSFFVGVLFLSSGDLTATVMALHSGRSPQGGGRRYAHVPQCRCRCALATCGRIDAPRSHRACCCGSVCFPVASLHSLRSSLFSLRV